MGQVENETNELQSLLANAAVAGRGRPPKSSPDTPGVKQESLLDHKQWEVLPNGMYIATGSTQQSLPPGAYTLTLTDSGKPIFSAKKILTDELIDLGDSNSRYIIEGIRIFWSKKKQYEKYGLLYKRGVLLWGPPGSGKTATMAILVKELIALGGIVIITQNPGVVVKALPVLRKIEPTRPLIIVLEDVEEIVSSYGEHDLLALLDGEHQTDNVVNIATTNYPETLGARIINRPSRFDEVKKIGMPTLQMREAYLNHVLKDEIKHYDIPQWVVDTEGMSIAHLKELVIAITCLDQPYKEVISRLKGMKSTPKSNMYGDVGFQAQQPKSAQAGSSASAR